MQQDDEGERTHAVGLVPIAPQMLAGMEAGWTQSIDKLGELVARKAETFLVSSPLSRAATAPVQQHDKGERTCAVGPVDRHRQGTARGAPGRSSAAPA